MECNLIWNHKYDFRPKLHDNEVQLPLYYIHFDILHNLIAQLQDFSQNECFIDPIIKKDAI